MKRARPKPKKYSRPGGMALLLLLCVAAALCLGFRGDPVPDTVIPVDAPPETSQPITVTTTAPATSISTTATTMPTTTTMTSTTTTVTTTTATTAPPAKKKVPVLRQAEDSWDCEITSAAMMIQFIKPSVSVQTLKEEMPSHPSDPNQGFVWTPGGLHTIYPPALVDLVSRHSGKQGVDLTNCGLAALKRSLAADRPVVVWLGNMAYPAVNGYAAVRFNTHAVCATEAQDGCIFYNDPWTGRQEKMTEDDFLQHWKALDCRALSYQ